MSRILARSVLADLCGRLLNWLLLALLFPVILATLALPQVGRLLRAVMRRGAVAPDHPLPPKAT